jgi:hypothetical protein
MTYIKTVIVSMCCMYLLFAIITWGGVTVSYWADDHKEQRGGYIHRIIDGGEHTYILTHYEIPYEASAWRHYTWVVEPESIRFYINGDRVSVFSGVGHLCKSTPSLIRAWREVRL